MKRNFLWAVPALAAGLWLGGAAMSASAQTDAGSDTAAGAAADASSATASTQSAAADAQSGTSATGSADTSVPASGSTAAATGATDAAASTDASTAADTSASAPTAGSVDAQSSTQSNVSGDAAASTGAQAPSPPAPAQPGASAGISADAGASTSAGAAAQPENQTPGATAPGTAAAPGVNVDASLQGDANLRTDAQAGAQQNLALQRGIQFGQATDRGLAINSIARDHFFFNSGLRQGDLLVSYAGRPIRSVADFNRWVMFQPGQRVPVVVLRDGRPQTIYVVYEQRPGVEYQAGYAPAPGGAYLGVTFDAQSPQQAFVRTVQLGSPAERAGIRPGDVIFAVNGSQVGGSQDVIRIVSSMQPGQPIDVAISRQVVLGSRPGVAQAAAYSPDVRIQGSVAPPQPVPAVPAPVPGSATVTTDEFSDIDAAVVPGSGRFDNTPARAGDVDRDGRLLDADGRVGPVEGRALLPRRRN